MIPSARTVLIELRKPIYSLDYWYITKSTKRYTSTARWRDTGQGPIPRGFCPVSCKCLHPVQPVRWCTAGPSQSLMALQGALWDISTQVKREICRGLSQSPLNDPLNGTRKCSGSPTWKLSKSPFGFLWRLYYISMIDSIMGHWWFIQPPPWKSEGGTESSSPLFLVGSFDNRVPSSGGNAKLASFT